MLNLIGFDFGASSGRAMLGRFDGGKLTMSTLHRFPNDPVNLAGRLVWDVPRLFYEMKAALSMAGREGIRPDGIGIDTWGVDFGLLDSSGALLGIPAHYRDTRTDGVMEKAFEAVTKAEIFERTGLAFMQFNTLYQLYAMKLSADPMLPAAETLLMMPDLLAYFLTGERASEYTIASTSQMIDPRARSWDFDLIGKFGLPKGIFTPLQQPGAMRGCLLEELAQEARINRAPVIAVGSHDTASAVAAVPAEEGRRFAYISSGTWSLLGAEIDAPMSSPNVMAANYTNEGGVCGKTRLLKNIMGLWILQELRREWEQEGCALSFDEMAGLAESAEPFISIVNVDDDVFLPPGNMSGRIREYCRATGQRAPETRGEFARVIYESLALKYRWGIERLEGDLLGAPVESMHIVGGGSRDVMLNRFTASALNRPVIAGPTEATAIGNLLMQAMALGAIESLPHLRRVAAASFPTSTYEPDGDAAAWDTAYERFLEFI